MYRFITVFIMYLAISINVFANETAQAPKRIIWPFDGIFGSVDREAAQRGYQIYKEVCSACHEMAHLSYRNLRDIGITDAEIKVIASGYIVTDGPNPQGEMFERPALPSDKFINPFPNEQAARAVNNGAFPVDLSLIIKAREDGPNYVYSLLNGYVTPPSGFKLLDGLHYNIYFPGEQIAMPQPLQDGAVQYRDGTVATLDQMARDVVVFLQWAAEPEMEHRKSMGLRAMIYITIFTILFYIVKRRIWARLK